MPDNNGAVNLGESAKPSEETEEHKSQRVHTAFLVIKDLDGIVNVLHYEGNEYLVETTPSGDEVLGMCATVAAEMQAQKTAMHTVQQQMIHAAQVQQQVQAQNIAQSIDLSKLRA